MAHEEFYKGDDIKDLYAELNKTAKSTKEKKATNALNETSKALNTALFGETNQKIDFEKLSKLLEEQNQNNFKLKYNNNPQRTTTENPVSKFLKLKSEIELIESDLNFYKQHPEEYKFSTPIEKSLSELNNVKCITNYMTNSKNFIEFQKLNDILNKNGLSVSKNNYNIFNKKLHNDLNEELNKKLQNLQKLKNENKLDDKTIEYQLFISPNSEIIPQLKEIGEIKEKIDSIEKKIGKWCNLNGEKKIADFIKLFDIQIRLSDSKFNNRLAKSVEFGLSKVENISNNHNGMYDKFNLEKLNNLLSSGFDAEEIEKILNNCMTKIYLLNDEHEKAVYMGQKIKELIEQQKNVDNELDENSKMLDELNENIKTNIEVMKKNIEIIKNKIK